MFESLFLFCEMQWNDISHSVVSDSATPWTVARQAPLSMGFSRQEYWSGQSFSSSGNLPNPGIKLKSPTLQADSLQSEPPGKPIPVLYIHAIVLPFRFHIWIISYSICLYIGNISFSFMAKLYPILWTCVCVCGTCSNRFSSVLTFCDPMDCTMPCCTIHGVFLMRILEWVAMLSARGSSPPRDWTHISCIGRWIL